jgi:hypothetical protein
MRPVCVNSAANEIKGTPMPSWKLGRIAHITKTADRIHVLGAVGHTYPSGSPRGVFRSRYPNCNSPGAFPITLLSMV